MLTDDLNGYVLREMLTETPISLFPSAEDRLAWAGISEEYRQEILSMAKQYAALSYPMRRATDFLAFVHTGSRLADENPYFFRRRKLCVATLSACLETSTDLDDVIDGIWCICEETSWVISAHNVNPIPGAPQAEDMPLPDPNLPYVDLFAAQTGMILALVCQLLKSRLDSITPQLCKRVEEEINRRILTPFMTTDDFWWMGIRRQDLNNWTPWILSNIMICSCLIHLPNYDIKALIERSCVMLDRWLDTIPADGGCDEGAGYWNLAGGALLDCLEILETITSGKMTFWHKNKIRNILSFPLKVEIADGWFANFADCDARPIMSGERLQYAGERLHDSDLITMGNRLRGSLSDQLSDTPQFFRILHMLFHPVAKETTLMQRSDVWLPDLQVRIVRRNGFVLCCKGGHNGENHNHNDVGSFMFYLDGKPEIVDAGNMIYTAQTFSSDRYLLWNVRSAYHNLPLIGGLEQMPGKEYKARSVHPLPNGLSLDIAGAYSEKTGLMAMQRELILTENGLEIRDRAVLKESKPIVWVFLLRNQPDCSIGQCVAGRIRISFPKTIRCDVEELCITDQRMARNFPGSLWRLCLSAASDISFDMKFCIEEIKPAQSFMRIDCE